MCFANITIGRSTAKNKDLKFNILEPMFHSGSVTIVADLAAQHCVALRLKWPLIIAEESARVPMAQKDSA